MKPWLLPLLLLAGCSHKATAAECQFLVDKSVELTIKDMEIDAGPEALAEAQEKQRKQLAGDIKESCQGRKLSDGMMKCARAAQTSDELAACIK